MWRSSWQRGWRAAARSATSSGAQRLYGGKANANTRRVAVGSLSAAYAVAGAGLAVAAVINYDKREEVTLSEARQVKQSMLSRNFIADAVEKTFPAVVNIAVDSGYVSSNGSGFIITTEGLIVTNAHVVARCNRYSKIQVTFADGSSYPAVIHSADTLSDIALLQIKSDEVKVWPMIAMGSSSELRPGEWVCALGSPFSLQNSVSAGIISAVARHSSELGFPQKGGEYIQTDAAINAGNSGGPLINLDGEVIGINTMKVDGSVGISFAIPVDTAVQVIDQLRKHKKVVRPYIGMQMINFNTRELQEIGRLFPDVKEGVIVKSVSPGSPAHKGGLLPGDVIVSFDDKNVHSTKDILSTVGYSIGRRIAVQVKRRGEKKLVKLYVVTEPLPMQQMHSRA
ncbi:Serine protease htra2, mitochondrial [Phytophthora boehmeriae]|uniref:Serine protease htra2, mitochondrial n=1 Tax=Phytophthora boehmeriae TaxID=109152 RepID=A0A8T1WTR2_9STRA|nr:Serine protease htra2, mitochondrial [Phytophthora boehmeriae]